MSRSAAEKKVAELSRRLAKEEEAHSETRRLLQTEISRVWRLVPRYKIALMGVYPPLRRLLHVLAEAADLQDPSKGANYEDTMRNEYTPDGETLTQTERAVLTHRKHRADVVEMNKRLWQVTDDLAHLIAAVNTEYNPPRGECEECGRFLFQTDIGRPRTYCSDRCRQRASRNVTKHQHPESAVSR